VSIGWTGKIVAVTVVAAVFAAAGDDSGLDSRRAYLYQAADRWWLPTSMAVGMLQDPFPQIRASAAQVLAVNVDPERWRLAAEYSRDASAGVRKQATLLAGRTGEAAVGVAVAMLRDRSAAVRQGAVWAASHGGKAAFEPITGLLTTERSPEVITTALANLWRFGDAPWEEHAARYANHEDANLRRAAAYALARSSSQRRSSALDTLCRDSEPVIRATAVGGLGEGPLSAVEQKVLIDSLSDSDWRVQAAACGALSMRGEVQLASAQAERIASLWSSDRGQLVVAALAAAGVHRGVGSDERLQEIVSDGEPWPAATALEALARRGATVAGDAVKAWLAADDTWRRRAAARTIVHLSEDVKAPLEGKVLSDREAAVRLALLESWDAAAAARRGDALWQIVDSDPDPVVRAAALGLLQDADAELGVDRMRALYQRWEGDSLPDARAAALAAAVLSADDEKTRKQILQSAVGDQSSTVAAVVFAETRRAGIDVVLPERESRHGQKWYSDLVVWSRQDRWLDVVTVRGTFRIRLDSQEAPITCREIWDLASEGFYDGLSFHRVVANFVIQGGDPRGDGWGGPGFVLPDEPSLRPFDSWRVGVATSGPNTGGCQFFVTLLPADRLTGHYTNFGEVVAGRDVLTRIHRDDRIVRVIAIEGTEPPPPKPVLVGAIGWDRLAELDGWNAARSDYRPDAAALEQLRSATGDYTVFTVLGTWCNDSAREVPRLRRVLEEAGLERFRHVMVAVDRTKRIGDADFPFGLVGGRTVDRVPTIVVVGGDNTELGKIIEIAEAPIEQLLVQFLAPVEGWR
jgi:cyclophilin family peptidyl-prolyl cis-trans isomerase/HEAT repeat protein